MLSSFSRTVWSAAFTVVLGLFVSAAAVASPGPGRPHGAAPNAKPAPGRVDVHRQPEPVHRPLSGGPLSYNAYWKAATSPNPPRTNQSYNVYWQKMQAWQEFQRRHP